MNEEEHFNKITELLKKFKNGEELYKRNPMFNRSIQMMVQGVSIYDVMEQIIITSETTHNAHIMLMARYGSPLNMNDLLTQHITKRPPLPEPPKGRTITTEG